MRTPTAQPAFTRQHANQLVCVYACQLWNALALGSLQASQPFCFAVSQEIACMACMLFPAAALSLVTRMQPCNISNLASLVSKQV